MSEITAPQSPDVQQLLAAATSPSPDVMSQFNAIRQRVNTVQPPESLPVAAQNDERKISYDIVSDKTGDLKATIYSTGDPKTRDEFAAAMKVYNVKGKVPGFTVLEPGTMKNIRDTFESTIGSPMRAAAAGIQQSPNMPSTSPYVPDVIQKPVAALANTLKGVAASVPQGLSTPEGFGTAAGVAASSMLLPGLGPLGMMLKTGVGAGLGYLAGDIAAGTNTGNFEQRLYETSKTAITAGITEGAIGVFKKIIGTDLSQQAQQGVADDMMQYVKDKFRPLINDPNAFKAITNSPTGIRDVVQMGVTGLRGDVNRIADTQVKEVVSGLRGLGIIDPADIKVLQQSMKGLVTKQNQWLDNIGGKTETMVKITDEVNGLVSDVMNNAMSIVKKLPATQSETFQQRYQQQVYSLLEGYIENVHKIGEAVPLFDALKKAGAGTQFDVAKFQTEIQPYYMSQPGSALNVAGKTAFRGSSGSATDIPYNTSIPYGQALNKIPGVNLVPGIGELKVPLSTGMNYVGKVRGTYPISTSAIEASTISSIRDYLKEK